MFVHNGGSGTTAAPPDQPFRGKIGRTVKDSKSDFPKGVEAPAGAPNVLLILTDDVGFGASSTFGGPIQTPTFQRVADAGLRYNTFHTTALCSPTRAALISGRNHHSCASGVITEMATGYPGYNSLVPRNCGTVAQVLRGHGYNTSWFGKMHNVPDWMSSRAGPFDLWPTGLGFEYFYGFIGGDSDQWHPALFENNVPIEPYLGKPDYILDRDLADQAIAWLQMQHSLAPHKPWFLYYATGTAHAPHHAPKEWIDRYKGKFDQGWDRVREETLARQLTLGVVPAGTQLSKRPEQIPAWDTLSADQKRLYAHMMEVYAGALSHADFQIGRLLDAVREGGQADNTLVIFIMGDNGASAEGTLQGTTNEVATAANGVEEPLPYLLSMYDSLGGPLTYNHYPVGWAHAMDSPLQWAKQVASHFGGTRNGMLIAWPGRIKDKGGLRTQFSSVIDIVPTIYEAARIQPPPTIDGVKQKRLDGTSLVYTFDDPRAPTRHTTQYFELVGNRGIYKDGWMASTTPLRLPWVTIGQEPSPDDFKWELYDVRSDFSQANEPGREESRQAQGAPGGLRCRGQEVQRLPARRELRFARRSGHPAQPDPRAKRVHVLPGGHPHPRGVRAQLQEQVICRGCRDCRPVERSLGGAGDDRRALRGLGAVARRRQAAIRVRALEPAAPQDQGGLGGCTVLREPRRSRQLQVRRRRRGQGRRGHALRRRQSGGHGAHPGDCPKPILAR